MKSNVKLLSVLCVSVFMLAACDDSDVVAGDGDDDANMAEVADQFGPGFAAAFRADPNGEPVDTDDIVITFLGVDGPNLTADPIDF